jgi:hypothetical protein
MTHLLGERIARLYRNAHKGTLKKYNPVEGQFLGNDIWSSVTFILLALKVSESPGGGGRDGVHFCPLPPTC